MYSESEIESAVTAGVLSPEAARALRAHVAASRATPAVDEEHFRLLTGFNDIFVSIAIVLLLSAIAGIAQVTIPTLGGVGVGAAAWGLAEYFTARRRMALPSIVLLIAFVGGIAATPLAMLLPNMEAMVAWVRSISADEAVQKAVAGTIVAAIAAATAAAAWLHWRRFMVPITVAAGAVAVVAVVLSLIVGLIPSAEKAIFPLVLAAGVAVFAVAMRWDMSDLDRRTRRSDVAFWLHLAAAPMIAHALFNMLGVFDGNMDAGRATVVLVLYVVFALVALAIDRRALLVSSLVYVLYALYALFEQAGAVELSAAFTGLVIGSALLLLSAFWHPMRARVVGTLGDTARRLPPVAVAA